MLGKEVSIMTKKDWISMPMEQMPQWGRMAPIK